MSHPTKTNTVSFIDENLDQGGKNTVLRKNTEHPGQPFALSEASSSPQFTRSHDSKIFNSQKPTLSGGLRFFSDAILDQVSGKLMKSS